MTVLVTADIHRNANPRDSYRAAWWSWMLAHVKQHHISTVAILGDLTDEKDYHPSTLVNELVDDINRLAELARVIILMGNHDYTVAENAFFEFLQHIPNVTWAGQIIDDLEIDDLGPTLWLPHTHDWKRDWDGLDFGKYQFIFAHNTFEGADTGHRKLEGIPTDIFPVDAQVISGDIHVPQSFGPITYVGSPYRVDFGDNFEPRVLHIKGGKVKSIASVGLRKQVLDINASELGKLKKTPVIKGDMFKVRVTLDRPSDYAQWPELKQKIAAWADEANVILHMAQAIKPKASRVSTKRKAEVVRSDEEVLEAYLKAQKQMDSNRRQMGLRIMKEV